MELVTKSKQIKKVLVKQFQIEKKSIFFTKFLTRQFDRTAIILLFFATRHVCRNDQYYHQDNNHLMNCLFREKKYFEDLHYKLPRNTNYYLFYSALT